MPATSAVQAGRLDEGQQWLDRADARLRSNLEPAIGFVLHMVHGVVHSARGRHRHALSRFHEAERLGLLLITGSPLATQLRCSMLLARLALSETAKVREALAEMPVADRDAAEMREVRAVLALSEGDGEAAVAVLAPTLDGDAEAHHSIVVVRSLLRTALAQHSIGNFPAVEDALERALERAEQDSLIAPFLDTQSLELLERDPHHRTAHGAYIAEIRDVLSGSPGSAPRRAQPPALLEDLSDAELRVLRFLPTSLSAGAIASEIYVSVNTVKTHMRHIYPKLDAHSRIEAVKRARELALLGQSAHRL